MGVGRIALDLGRRLEAHVVVAVRNLRLAARIDDVELRGDLVEGSEPRFARQRNHGVAVVGGEGLRIGEAQFFQRVPHPVVGAGLGEVIAVT